jgi:hypothetical protein
MKKLFLFLTVFTLAVSLFSCKKTQTESPLAETQTLINNAKIENSTIYSRGDSSSFCPATITTLIAGQTINSGDVTVTNDSSYFYVTYRASNGYSLKETHLYLGACEFIPVNKTGNPIPGHFPYNGFHANIATYTYQIPVSLIPAGLCGCVAAHAVVVRVDANGTIIEQQSAWGNGTVINPTGNWGMKFNYCRCIL